MTEHDPIDHGHYGDVIRHLRLGETRTPTHVIVRPVEAYRIVATDMLADGLITVIQDGEVVTADVPRGFFWVSTPIPGDYLTVDPDGTVGHRAKALFEAEAQPTGSRGAQLNPGQQISSVHDVRPSGTALVVNADGDTKVILVPAAGLPMVPRFQMADAV
ncbi:hypothetical protein G3T14_21385 [Methylobacterium sp. BTF04]|uniref:hypothetical protein n=1 Tax=Methylobacterium sp. BTF04 TaxID=2708300 RepID=UPI0013D1D1F1|nr:hypothetical protein [Methylobacterium sp. BTF04]NEU14640.1 hypothetical protein [Methylobacterium sp. BTF04]